MPRATVLAVCLSAALLGAAPPAAAPPSAPQPEAAPPAHVAPLIAKADAAYARRDRPGALDEVQTELDQAEKIAPDDYGVLWRLARLYFWRADDPALDNKAKSRFGKQSWEYAERAIRANPNRVEGWEYAASGMGNYALGIGTFAALRQGIEGKFKDRLSHAERIDPKFEGGAIQTAWGRFWFKLPWPKYDARKSERALLAALQLNPDNVRARVYLADLYRREHKDGPAQDQLERATAEPPGRYDEPEERRWQEVARQMLAAK